ncbi:MAG: metallophosphatase family protein [Planctomycetia bacterium]|nr:metallophosphatase family protein [Planctomycetia bacterium]
MRIGIVTDIHDEHLILARVLAELRSAGVDAIVSLGDTSDLHGKYEAVTEVTALLKQYEVVGVWGNHDHGLCRDVPPEARKRFPPAVFEYMSTLKPRMELGGCHFTHIEPWLDTEKLEDLWCFDGRPEDPDRLEKSFAAVPHRAIFLGHFHRWLAVTDRGRTEWDGSVPLHFEPDSRYLVVVGPLFRGDFAIIDTDRWVLEPRRLTNSSVEPSA